MESEEKTGFVVGATIKTPQGEAEVIDVRGKAWLKVQANETVKKGWWQTTELAELNPEAYEALVAQVNEKKLAREAAAEARRAAREAARQEAATAEGEEKPKRRGGRKSKASQDDAPVNSAGTEFTDEVPEGSDAALVGSEA